MVVQWHIGKALDSQSIGSSPTGAKLHNNLGQVVHTYVPLSPSSITWYWSKDGDILWLERWQQALRKVMAWLKKSPAGWLPVHWDQLWAQRSVPSMGELYHLHTSLITNEWVPAASLPCQQRHCQEDCIDSSWWRQGGHLQQTQTPTDSLQTPSFSVIYTLSAVINFSEI